MKISDKIKTIVTYKYDFFALAIFIALILFLFRDVIFTKGSIQFGDFTVPSTLDNYLHFYYPSWNEFGSFSTFQFTNRLLTYGPFLLVSAVVGLDVSIVIKFLALFPLVLSFASMYLASGTLLKMNGESINDRYTLLSRFFASCIFALNPWVITEIRHFSLVWGYAFVPVILTSFMICLNVNKPIKQLIVIPLLLSLASVTPHWIVFNTLLLASVLFYFSALQLNKKEYSQIISNIIKFIIIIGIYAIFNAYWIIQYILANRYTSVSPTYIFSNEVIDMLSRNSNFVNVAGLYSGWWPQVNPILQGYQNVWIIVSFVLIIITLVTLICEPKNKTVNYFGFLSIFALALSMGTKSSFADLYYNLSFDFPLISSRIGWVFRNPSKWVSIIATIYSFAALFLFHNIYTKKLLNYKFRNYVLIVFTLIIISSFFIHTSPTIDGYSNNVLNPVQIPNEYYNVNSWLSEQDGGFKTLWVPPYNGRKSTWSEGHMLGAFDIMSSSTPTFGAGDSDTTYYLYYLYNNYNSHSISKYIGFLNTKYIVHHKDVIGAYELNNIVNDNSLKNVISDGFISVFENSEYAPHVNIVPQNIAIFGGLDTFTSLINIDSFSPLNTSVYFAEQIEPDSSITKNSSMVILPNNPNLNINNRYLVKVFDKTTHHNPNELWSKAATNEPLHGPWHYYLENNDIQNWQFDYGKGLVLTWAKNTILRFSVKTETTDEYVLLVRYFENQKGGSINIHLDDKPIYIDTQSQLNRFIWKDIGTYHLEKGEHEIILENLEGFNSVNLFALIPEDEYKKAESEFIHSIQNKRIIYLLEAESDVYSESAEVNNIFDEASNGKVLTFNQDAYAWQEIEVLRNDSYMVAIQSDGELEVSIDNKVNNFTQELSMTYYGPIELDKGKHIIEITPSKEMNKPNLDEKSKPYLDAIWLYSAEKNETLEDILSSNEVAAEIRNYEKIDSTQYKIHVNASSPYMLSFAESYDPLWVAEIDTVEGVKKYQSIPLYSVINGFWIDETGEYIVTIRYRPQQWFYYGVIVSVLAFVVCSCVLFFNCRRGRKRY